MAKPSQKSTSQKNKLNIVNMCFGSYILLNKGKTSKGLFYTYNSETNKYILIDNRNKYTEYTFDTLNLLQNYVQKELKL